MLAHPDQSISEVLAGLAERKVHVSRSLISQVRAKLGQTRTPGTTEAAKKKGPKKKASGASVTASRTTSASTAAKRAITADELYDAKTLAEELGRIQRLRDAMDALERLR